MWASPVSSPPRDGEVVDNPRFLKASAEMIADLERRKSRARPGSGNRKRLGRTLAKEWRKVRNRRRDFHHKTARMLIDQCDAIALERPEHSGDDQTARGQARHAESGRVPAEPGCG